MRKNFVYSIDHIKVDETTSKKELLLMMEDHDKNSFLYSFFTGAINYAILQEYKKPVRKPKKMYFECGLFHDIGKLGMEYDFLNYPGPYTKFSYQEMKKHTTGGGEILKRIGAEQELVNTALYHHCNFDGSGYPGNLIGKEIPFEARLTRISDSLDAYLSKRCYKEGGPANEAFDDLNQFKGSSYDPELIDAFYLVHQNIMDESHRYGEDRPSKDMYFEFLIELYLSDFEMNSVERVLELI